MNNRTDELNEGGDRFSQVASKNKNWSVVIPLVRIPLEKRRNKQDEKDSNDNDSRNISDAWQLWHLQSEQYSNKQYSQ